MVEQQPLGLERRLAGRLEPIQRRVPIRREQHVFVVTHASWVVKPYHHAAELRQLVRHVKVRHSRLMLFGTAPLLDIAVELGNHDVSRILVFELHFVYHRDSLVHDPFGIHPVPLDKSEVVDFEQD